MKVSDETMLFRKVDDEPMTAKRFLLCLSIYSRKRLQSNQSNLRVSYF